MPTKSATKRVRGPLVELLRRADLEHAAVLHHRHAVGERQRLFLVVGHVDGRDAELLLELADLGAHLHADLRVEVRERLVEQQDVRVEHERPRQRHALLLTARELSRVARLEAREVDLAQPFVEPRRDLGRPELPQLEAVGDVVRDRHVGPERVVLEHHADVPLVRRQPVHHAVAEADLARVGLVEAGHEPQQRRLAAARRAQEREQLAVIDGEVGPIHRGDGAEPLDDARGS